MSVTFHIADYVLFVVIILISLGIGIFISGSGGPQKTTGDYLLGGRNMKVLPVSISLVVSYVSTITFLGISAEIYYFGAHLAFLCIAHIIGALLAAGLFLPLLYPLKVTSANQYLMMRYNSRVATLMGTSFQVINWLCICGIVSIGFAYMFKTISDFPVWATLVIMLISSSIYTFVGGFKAVVWTDVFQSAVMVAGLIAVVIRGLMVTGGPAQVIEIYEKWGRNKLEWSPSPWNRVDMWSVTVLLGIKRMVIFGVLQGSVQRYNSLPTFKKAVSSLFLALPSDVVFSVLSVACGMLAFAYYTELGCDPLKGGSITTPNQIIPALVVDILNYPGVIGLFVAAVLAGVLSTISTGLSALSAMTWHDLLEPYLPEISSRKQLLITKGLVLFYGCMGLIFSFVLQNIGGTLVQMTIAIPSSFITSLGVIYVLGATYPRLNYKGACTITSLIFVLVMWVTIGSIIEGKQYKVLPTETSGCNTTNTYSNLMADGNLTHYALPETHNITVTEPTDVIEEIGFLTSLYQISTFWYSAIGISVALTLGFIFSYIPVYPTACGCAIFSKLAVFQEEIPADPKYIFPVLRRFTKDVQYNTVAMETPDVKPQKDAHPGQEHLDLLPASYTPKDDETLLNGNPGQPQC